MRKINKRRLFDEAAEIVDRRARFARRAQALGLTVDELKERVRLQRRTKALGLAYWPALRFAGRQNAHGVDPEAFLVAEEILCKHSGSRYGVNGGRGGVGLQRVTRRRAVRGG